MINGIKRLRFAVEDLDKTRDYLDDFGLRAITSDEEGVLAYELHNGSQVWVYPLDDPGLPQPFEQGSTLRQLTWAANREQDRQVLANKLKDEPGFAFGGHTVSGCDAKGMHLRLVVMRLTTDANQISQATTQY